MLIGHERATGHPPPPARPRPLCRSRGGALAQDIPVLSSTNDLHALTQGVWTNTQTLMILPPGPGPTRTTLGALAFDQAFDPAFLAALDPVTNGGVTRYPLEAVETNTVPRTRRYLNATGGLVQTTGVPAGYDPTQLVHAAYGNPPAWLSGPDRALWYEDRMPDRMRVTAELIATSDVPAYLALLTNGIGTAWDGVTNVPLLTLYSNDLALVRMEQASEQVAAWVHAPPGVGQVDLYGSADLLFPLGWQLLATLAPGPDPRPWSGSSPHPLRTLAAGNPGLDGDGDDLADARELLLYGTDPGESDTDGDGLLDGAEINRYDLDPMDADTDGDGYTDGAEVAMGKNPTNPGDGRVDTDGDGVPDTMETAAGCTSPAHADVFTRFQLARLLGLPPIRVSVVSDFSKVFVRRLEQAAEADLTQNGVASAALTNAAPCAIGESPSHGDGRDQYTALASVSSGATNQTTLNVFLDHYDGTPGVAANGVAVSAMFTGAEPIYGYEPSWSNSHDTVLASGPTVTPSPTGMLVSWSADMGYIASVTAFTDGGYGHMRIPYTAMLPQLQIAPTAAYRCVGGGAVTLSVVVANMAWTGEIWWAVTPTGAGGPRFAVGGGVAYSGGTNAVLQMGTNPGVYTVTAAPRGIAPLAATAKVVVRKLQIQTMADAHCVNATTSATLTADSSEAVQLHWFLSTAIGDATILGSATNATVSIFTGSKAPFFYRLDAIDLLSGCSDSVTFSVQCHDCSDLIEAYAEVYDSYVGQARAAYTNCQRALGHQREQRLQLIHIASMLALDIGGVATGPTHCPENLAEFLGIAYEVLSQVGTNSNVSDPVNSALQRLDSATGARNVAESAMQAGLAACSSLRPGLEASFVSAKACIDSVDYRCLCLESRRLLDGWRDGVLKLPQAPSYVVGCLTVWGFVAQPQ